MKPVEPRKEISLPEFFLRLWCIASEKDIPTPPLERHEAARVFNSTTARIQDRMIHLVRYSELSEDLWNMHRSAYRSLWNDVLPILKAHNFFAEFEGDEVLSKKLDVFIRGKNAANSNSNHRPGRR